MSAKILVVDDSATDRLIIKSILDGYEVLLAEDGYEAIQQLNMDPQIELLILDLNMPKMDGFQVLELLKSEEKYNKLRAIILTNYDELDSEIKGLRLGAVDYIRKPVNMDSLRVRIDMQIELIRMRKLTQSKFEEKDNIFNAIFEQAPVGISISLDYKPDEVVLDEPAYINAMFEQICGRKKEELVRLGWVSITHPDDVERDWKNYRNLKENKIDSYSLEKRYIRPDGSIVWVYMIVALFQISDDKNNKHLCIIQDITKLKEIEERLRYFNQHDELTGLHNRKYLEEILLFDSRSYDTVRQAMICINLSTMHTLTLTYGYDYSCQLIRKISESLKIFCDDKHTLFKTNEFHFMFYVKSYYDKEELLSFCNSLTKLLESELINERIGGGLGILEINERNCYDIKRLFKFLMIASERALNSLKTEFGIIFFDEGIEEKIFRDEEISRVMSQISAGENADRLFLQFQPILDLKSNKISCFEALARLKSDHPKLIPPLEFIPIAERTKLIIPMGDLIIRKSLLFLRKLKENGYDQISLSINISAIQLFRDEFVENLLCMIEEYGVDPQNVGIELTESVFSVAFQDINSILSALRENGIKIAIDDFGTGYSSFARERELNIDCVKIDKLFIKRLLMLESEEAITGDIISMAHRLGHDVVAEGVEHEKQLHYLREHGCDRVQGYLISRPISEQDAFEFLKNYDSIF